MAWYSCKFSGQTICDVVFTPAPGLRMFFIIIIIIAVHCGLKISMVLSRQMNWMDPDCAMWLSTQMAQICDPMAFEKWCFVFDVKTTAQLHGAERQLDFIQGWWVNGRNGSDEQSKEAAACYPWGAFQCKPCNETWRKPNENSTIL